MVLDGNLSSQKGCIRASVQALAAYLGGSANLTAPFLLSLPLFLQLLPLLPQPLIDLFSFPLLEVIQGPGHA